MQDESLDKKSIFSIFTEYKTSLSRFVRRYGRLEGDVEDILQETFLNTFAASKNSTIEFPKKYLFTTAKHLASREKTRVSAKLTDYIEDSSDSILLSNDEDAFQLLSAYQEQQILKKALASLPSKCQQVTRMRLIHGMRLKDIAEQLALSVSTVEKHVAKGLERCDDYVSQATTEARSNDGVSVKKRQQRNYK